jgi:hypothetical protein
MRTAFVFVVVAVVLGFGVDFLGDLTQSRRDPVDADEVSEIVLSVDQDRFGGGQDAAANALWAVCAAQTTSRMVVTDHLQPLGDRQYRAVLQPAVGDNDERQLVGCLEDLTVERVRGDVESFRTLPASGYAQRAG